MCTMENYDTGSSHLGESNLEISGESVVQGPRGLEDLISEMHVMWE